MRSKEVEVITLLTEKRDTELSINGIAKLLRKDYKSAHNIVTRLSRMGLLELRPFGRSHRVLLRNTTHPLIFEAEYHRRRELLKNKDIAVMHDAFRGLRSGFYVLLVSGSYAKRTQTKHSDIDLLFIVPDAAEGSLEREIQGIAGTLPLTVHIHVFRETDFKAMRDSKESTVGSEAIKNNVILRGIESYYELIS